MKVSFSLSSSKDSSKPSNSTLASLSVEPDQSDQKEFITEFDPSKTLTDSRSKPPLVIPPIPNQWNPKSVDLPIPESEVDTNSASESIVSGITDGGSDPLSAIDRLMLIKLRNDLKRLPEHRGLEEYEDVPVREFARAYLKGYGWCEGRGIGKNAKEDVKVVEYKSRPARVGLGFVRTDDSDDKVCEIEEGVLTMLEKSSI